MEIELFNMLQYPFWWSNCVNEIKVLINQQWKLKVLILKNWVWNSATFFSLYNHSNIKSIELINNKINYDQFWRVSSNSKIIKFKNCFIVDEVIGNLSVEQFNYLQLFKNSKGNYSNVQSFYDYVN